ncbi:hypothetical protein O1L55_09675 [Streptomyces albulus]|nr:hypothetical protein [Streptomyces noursei]
MGTPPLTVSLPGYPSSGSGAGWMWRCRRPATRSPPTRARPAPESERESEPVHAERARPESTGRPRDTVLLAKEWQAAPVAAGELPRSVAVLAAPGSRALAMRLCAELPHARLLLPDDLAADAPDADRGAPPPRPTTPWST